MIAIIFGVSGAGKTTVGKLLARKLGWRFLEADDFHPAANVEKMRSGHPLTDEDRWPWLERLREQIKRSLAAEENAVLVCSALKRKYRDCLRVNSDVKFVFLRGDYELIAEQLRHRRGHFMNPDLLRSQFADLEEPEPDEGVLIIELGRTPKELVEEIKTKLDAKLQAAHCVMFASMKAAASDDGIVRELMPDIDRTLLRENLKLTFEQRARKHLRVLQMVEELRRAGKKLRQKSDGR